MAKIKHSAATKRRKKRVLKRAKGFWLDRSKQFQQARRALLHALTYAYAACRAEGVTYSRFMAGLKKAQVALDRKMIAEIAVKDEKVFKKLLEIAKG
jgi:large subunit ribosomal protein L20